MKTNIFSVAVVLAICGYAIAQMSPEEAQQRLAERQVSTSQPSDAEEISDLKQVVADQRQQIEQLKAQVAKLIADNAATKKEIAANPPLPANASQISKGMTKAQAVKLLGDPASDTTSSDGTETILWSKTITIVTGHNSDHVPTAFGEAEVERIEARFVGGTIVDFTDQKHQPG
jgi:uncharacterized coiled-coil protein SlyX